MAQIVDAKDSRRDLETYAIIGAAMMVHRQLGRGFLELVYQEALEVELGTRGIPYGREVEIQIHYRGPPLPARYRADFICFGNVLVELKAASRLTGTDHSQIINYLVATEWAGDFPLTAHRSPLTAHRSPLTAHNSPRSRYHATVAAVPRARSNSAFHPVIAVSGAGSQVHAGATNSLALSGVSRVARPPSRASAPVTPSALRASQRGSDTSRAFRVIAPATVLTSPVAVITSGWQG